MKHICKNITKYILYQSNIYMDTASSLQIKMYKYKSL